MAGFIVQSDNVDVDFDREFSDDEYEVVSDDEYLDPYSIHDDCPELFPINFSDFHDTFDATSVPACTAGATSAVPSIAEGASEEDSDAFHVGDDCVPRWPRRRFPGFQWSTPTVGKIFWYIISYF